MRWIPIVCLLIGLAVIAGTVSTGSEPAPDYEKILLIHLDYNNEGYTLTPVSVRYGRAPDWRGTTGNLEGALLGSDGTKLRSFRILHPGIVVGDMPGKTPTSDLLGYTAKLPPGDLDLIVPYKQDMQKFQLADIRSGVILATVDLNPPVKAFCTDYPKDPDCLNRIARMKAAVPDTGTAMLLITLLGVSILVAAGIGYTTIRWEKKAPGPGPVTVVERNTILIVDDNQDVIEMISLLLGAKGYGTITAEGGMECLEILKKQTPDMVLLDVMMEPMDGWQTLEEIKKNPGTKNIPILMITGKRLSAAEAKHYKVCIDDYIMKPFDAAELYAAVDYLLERKKKIRETLDMATRAGVTKEKVCEFAKLNRRITVNKKIVTILQGPAEAPAGTGPELPDTREVIDYINLRTRDEERQAEQLRQEINSRFRSKGLPEFSL